MPTLIVMVRINTKGARRSIEIRGGAAAYSNSADSEIVIEALWVLFEIELD